jgi:hypothetical protein
VTVISSRASPLLSAVAARILALGKVLKTAAIATASLAFMLIPFVLQFQSGIRAAAIADAAPNCSL